MEAVGSVLPADWEDTGERMDFCNIFITSEVKLYPSNILNLPLTAKDH